LNAAPIPRTASVIIHAPTIPSEGRRRVQHIFGWNDPDRLVASFIEDMREASHGVADYRVVERVEVDEFPVKADGFRYEAEEYAALWRQRTGFHQPDLVDYSRLLEAFDTLPKIRSGAVDEVWLMGFPYGGYYESWMAGPGSFWCNSPALEGWEAAGRRFVVMGFNYERGVGEMMESYGHRAESILRKVHERVAAEDNLWERFTRYDLRNPGQAEVGNIHFAPNSERDYDWGNHRVVPSACDDWYDFPNLAGRYRSVDCREWGNGDIRLHHIWWYRHLPHVQGETDGVLNNWWAYVIDPDLVG
jgi:hypothetical protein